MDILNQQISQVKAGVNASAVQAINNTKTQASELVSSLTSKLKSAALTGVDILGAIPNIGQKIFGSVGSLFQEVNAAANTVLGNFTQEKQQIISRNLSQIPKTLGVFGNGGNLSSKGLGFIASTTNKAIEGVDLPGAELFTSFTNMGVGQLGRLTSMGGEVLNSSSNALNAITSSIQEARTTGTNIVNNVTGGIAESVNTILAPITGTASSVATLLNPYSVANVVSSNLDFLPSPVKGYASASVGNSVSTATANTLNSIGNSMGINNLAGATNSITNILSNYGNKYYNRTDVNGNYVNGVSSYNGDNSNFNTIMNLASTLCTSLDRNFGTIDFSTNKGLYDMLIELACQLGLGGLAEALLNCLDSDTFFDSRTKQILGDIAKKSALNGDTYSTNLSFKYALGYVSNPNSVITTTVANSNYTTSNRTNINNMLNTSNITLSNLTNNQYFYTSEGIIQTRVREVEPPVYDAEIITVMQHTCTDYVDETITKKDRNLVNNVYNLWHKEKKNTIH